MSTSKFRPGDVVEIINYGAYIYDSELGRIDILSGIVGKVGTVLGSYRDVYPQYCQSDGSDTQHDHQYHVDGIPEKCAWYLENQLQLSQSTA